MARRTSLARSLLPAAMLLAGVLAFALFTGAAPAHKQGHKHGHHHHKNHKHHKKPAKPPKSFYGVDPLKPVDDQDLAKMRSTGITLLRTGFYWQSLQPTNGTDPVNFSRYDDLIRESAKYGITVLPYIYGTPDWVSKGLDHYDSCDPNCTRYAPKSEAARSALTSLTSKLAARYGPGGDFWTNSALNQGVPKKPIRKWQIWNEENSTGFYLPKVDPARYAKLLSAAAKGIRSQDRKATIILGGVFGLPRTGQTDHQGASGPMAGADFVRKLLKVKGAKKDFDGVAVHPYSHTMKFVKKQATLMRSTLKKSHDPGASLWITETGAASGGPAHPLNLGSEKAQAKRVTDTYKLFTKHRKDWNVKLVAWFSWEDVPDFPVASCPFCSQMGLVDADGNAKPSLRAYKRTAK